MAFLNSLNITGSALTAERMRIDVIAQNLASQSVTRTANGEPYRRKQVIFEERPTDFKKILAGEQSSENAGGVRVAKVIESDKPFIPVYDPSHPHADENGYVLMPNVNTAEENLDLLAATRAYEANITALTVVKAMALRALDIGK